jgi:Transglutaminase-like superfamily
LRVPPSNGKCRQIVIDTESLYQHAMLTVPIFANSRASRMVVGFLSMPVKDKTLLFVAWCLLGLVAAGLRLVPFRRLAPLLGVRIGTVAFVPTNNAAQASRARWVRFAILQAARVAPFRSDCLPQAFAAAILCRFFKVPVSTHLGVKLEKESKEMAAHAWACSGAVAISGGRSFETYTAVACFVSLGS